MSRKWNFYAGPSTMPMEVLEEIKNTIVDYHGAGLSIIETSHRSKEYDNVHLQAMELARDLLKIPSNYKVLFLGGGATLQFSMVPMNLLSGEKICDFTLTGSWAAGACKDARKLGKVNVLFDGEDTKFTTLPEGIRTSPGSSYLHITSNETIGGLQWQNWPDTGDVPLVADMSSDIMSRPIPVEKFGLIYAGAQKNLGPAGTCMVIIREDLLARSSDKLTAYLNYRTHAETDSLFNTPPVFSIYGVKLVMEWLKKRGGLAAVETFNRKKAALIYNAIDSSSGFYNCPVEKKSRSLMNIVFTLSDKNLEGDFLSGASDRGMLGLKGHRSVGGFRASVYNAMPIEGAQALADYMEDFAQKKG